MEAHTECERDTHISKLLLIKENYHLLLFAAPKNQGFTTTSPVKEQILYYQGVAAHNFKLQANSSVFHNGIFHHIL